MRSYRTGGVLATAALGAAALSGCRDERVQSALHPAGPAARDVADLWWIMFGLGTAVFLVVMVFAAVAVLRGRSERPPLGNRWFILSFGFIGPGVILVVLLFFALQTMVAVRQPDTGLTVQVIGHKWWWEVRYPDHGIVTANEIRIPVGQPVHLEVWSKDVIHSFWVPQLHGKIDLLPEHANTFWMQADREGVYRGQCAEFCGLQHARMAFVVVAEEKKAFDTWLRRQAQPAAAPDTPEVARGLEVFFDAGCAECHAIRGTPAEPGEVAPDLTHFGTRLTIGAGQRTNTTGDLSGWIANPQAVKPGNFMPPSYLTPEELHAVVAYLQSLR